MSMHKIPLSDTERAGLSAHGLDIGRPSQLSDAFRQGIAWCQGSELSAALAKVEELERDAMRYRHLRASFVRGHSHDLRWFLWRTTPLTAEGLDKDIDAAIASTQKTKQ